MLCFRWTFTHCRCLSHSLSHLSVCSSVFRTRHPALTEHSQNHQTTRVASVCKHKCTGREKNWKRKVWLSSSWMDYPLQSLWPSVSPCRMVWSQAWTTFGFFYTGLPDHRRNSYLSLELIMPSLPPPPPPPAPTHLDVEKSAFLISLDAVRKITTSQACVSACVLEQVTSGTVKDGEKEHEIG